MRTLARRAVIGVRPAHEQAPRSGNRGATSSTDFPTVAAATDVARDPVVVAVTVTARRDTRHVVIVCPYCRRRHSHGWGYDAPGEPGHRLSHCGSGRGYVITVPALAVTP